MKYLLDTNILSRIYRREPHPQIAAWLRAHASVEMYLSAVSIAEIRCGIELARHRHPPIQADRLAHYLDMLQRHHAGRILPFEEVAAHHCGLLMARHPNHPLDAQIAATALAHQATLVTSDRGFHDFAAMVARDGVALSLVDPLES